MRIRNPHYVPPIQAEAQALAPKLTAYLQTKPNKEFVGLAALRSNIPEAAAASREVINHALGILGVEIDDGGSDNA